MATATVSTHGVMEGGGSYNLHAKIPAGGGSLSFSDAGKRHTFADCLEQKLKRRLSERPTPLHSFVQVMVLANQRSTDTDRREANK
jgi:hypothetical protein